MEVFTSPDFTERPGFCVDSAEEYYSYVSFDPVDGLETAKGCVNKCLDYDDTYLRTAERQPIACYCTYESPDGSNVPKKIIDDSKVLELADGVGEVGKSQGTTGQCFEYLKKHPGYACSINDDCTGTSLCVDSICTVQCTADAECASNDCDAGTCQPFVCVADSDCDTGYCNVGTGDCDSDPNFVGSVGYCRDANSKYYSGGSFARGGMTDAQCIGTCTTYDRTWLRTAEMTNSECYCTYDSPGDTSRVPAELQSGSFTYDGTGPVGNHDDSVDVICYEYAKFVPGQACSINDDCTTEICTGNVCAE
jgi:hypothetical protein